MSDVNIDFVVSNNNINFTVEPNDITFTPEDIQLSIYNGGLGIPGGNPGELQYNNGGLLGGVANTSFSGGNLTLGEVANIKIAGGASGYLLITDGAGNLSWAAQPTFANNANFANFAGNVTVSSQPNITNLGTQLNFRSNGNVNFTTAGNVLLGTSSNVKLTGGLNGYFLQTDGTGNLTWSVGTGGGNANGTPGGANTQIQFNDAGIFGGNIGFTFNKVTGNVNAINFVGNLSGNLNGTVATSSQPNITSLGNLVALNVEGLSSIQEATEKVTIAGASSGTVNFDVLTQAILFANANATANFTLNIRGNSTVAFNSVVNSNQSMTLTFINNTGAIAYYPTAFTIDGAGVTPLWQGIAPTAAVSNSKNVYTFNIIKLASSTYTVLGSYGSFA